MLPRNEKPERGYVRMFLQNEKKKNGTRAHSPNSLAIIEFGAFQVIVHKNYCRLGEMEFKESSFLI